VKPLEGAPWIHEHLVDVRAQLDERADSRADRDGHLGLREPDSQPAQERHRQEHVAHLV
jgi:hypothetical protein